MMAGFNQRTNGDVLVVSKEKIQLLERVQEKITMWFSYDNVNS